MTSELNTFKNALHEFEPYSKNYAQNTAGKLKDSNSDFTYHMERGLEHLGDSKAPALMSKLSNLQRDTQAAIKAFEALDKEQAKKFKGSE